jgi:type I restriction enzyme S subunit
MEVDNIPEEWVKACVEDLGMIQTERIDPTDYPETEFELWSVPSYETGSPKYVKGEEIGSRKQIVQENDVLLSRINPRLNRVWVVTEQKSQPQIASTEWVVFRCQEINSRFLRYALLQPHFKRLMCDHVSGVGGSLSRTRKRDLRQFEIGIPPFPEQRRIADRLDAIQSRTQATGETLNQVPDRIEEYRQSVLNAAFSGRLTADWREDHTDVEPAEAMLKRILDKRRERWENDYRAKYEAKGKEPPSGWKSRYSEPDGLESPSDLANLPETWTWARVERLCWASRYGTSEKCDYDQEGPPVLRIPNIRGRKVTLGDMKFAASGADLSNIDPLRPGDFLVIRTNGSGDIIGRAGLIEEKFEEPHFFASYLIRFRLLSVSSLPEWFNLIWDSPIVRREIVQEAASSAGQYNISQSAIFDFALPLPPADEMEELVRRTNQRLDKIAEMAQHVEQADERLNHLDRSVLAKAFRGELVETEADRARREDRDYETAEELLNRVKEKTTRDTGPTAPKYDGDDSTEVNENGQIEMKVVEDGDAEL